MQLTIIQTLKKIKHLGRKIDRTQERIGKWCSFTTDDKPLYNQEEIRAMIQSVGDMSSEVAGLKHALHLVNATLEVEFEGKKTTIDGLLLETNVIIPTKLASLKALRRKEKNYHHKEDVEVVLQYDPRERDMEIDRLTDYQASINDFLDELNIKVMV